MATEIASFYATIGADDSGFKKAMQGVGSELTSTQKGFGAFKNVAAAGLAGVGLAAVAAGGAVVAGMGSAIKAGIDFEQNITDVAAVMSLTGKEAEQLQEHIMELGLSDKLKVSASEATDAVMSLGTAGLTLDQIMNGASEATVQLSNATGGDMASSATLLTDAMSQFNITAEESGRIVDQVTGLTVASKFGFGDVALAMAQAGGVAGSVGMEFEDFAAILGVTAANFSSGSDAGTSAKTMLTTLIPKSQEAADVMGALGLVTIDYARMAEYLSGVLGSEVEPNFMAVEEAFKKTTAGAQAAEKGNDALAKAFNGLKAQYSENQFFDDTTGAMKSAEEIAGTLATAFAGLSEEQKLEAASTIFGNDAMRTAFGLIDAGTPGITKMKEEIEKVDAGSIAAKRMDTFAGALEIAQGVIESLSIGIGQKFLPVLRPMIESFSTLAATHGPKLIDFFGKFAEGMGAAIQGGIEWAQNVLPPLWQRMTEVGNAIKIVTQLVMTALRPITDAIGKWVGWKDVLMAVGLLLTGAVLTAIGGFIAAMLPVILLVAKVTAVIVALKAAWQTNFLGIRDITLAVFDRIAGWIKTYTGLWKGDWSKTLNFILKNSGEAWHQISHVVRTFINEMVDKTRHTIAVWIETIMTHVDYFVINGRTKIKVWADWIKKYFNDAKEWAIERWQAVVDWFQRHVDILVSAGRNIVNGLKEGMQSAWNTLMNWWNSVWGKDLTKTVKVEMKTASPSKVMMGLGQDVMQGFGIGAEKMLPYVEGVMAGIPQASMSAGQYAYAGAPSSSSQPATSTARIEQLLEILIAELRNKNMSVNINGGGGGLGHMALVDHVDGMRR